jgi:predicted nuclease of restriction endonuclease-like RecB superfamily
MIEKVQKVLKVPEVTLLLTSDLLVTRISRGKIKPEYATLDSENLELARLLIETFEQHVGKTYGDLLAELEGYEEMNYRFIRGLSQLLGRRAVIETDAAVDPSLARETVFQMCEGMVLSPAEKQEVLQKAAERLSISVEELEKALWADLEENQILKSFLPLSPAEILKQYNISLTQTLLFRAVDLDIWIRGDFQKILWRILRSGLMYSLEDTEEPKGKKEGDKRREADVKSRVDGNYGKGVYLHLDGPASLFRMSERYGNSFAKIFPTLLRSKGWRLKAGILHKGFQGKRILEFTLDDSEEAFKPSLEAIRYSEALFSGLQIEEAKEGYGAGKKAGSGTEEVVEKAGIEKEIGKEAEIGFAEEAGIQETDSEEAIYDSTLEKTFGSLSLGSWKIKREPTILKAGRYAFVPDFSLQRASMKVYLEIVGFWTPEYLEKKVEKLREVKEPLILLIDRKLKCSEKDFPAQEVIFFDKKIPANEIMKILRKYEEKQLTEDKSTLQETEISLSGELISLAEIAAEKGVLLDALKNEIAERLSKSGEPGDYFLLENYLLHRQLLDRINLELEKPGAVRTYGDAVKLFEGFGLDRSLYYPVLEHLGYKVIWTGLSEEDAMIKKAI